MHDACIRLRAGNARSRAMLDSECVVTQHLCIAAVSVQCVHICMLMCAKAHLFGFASGCRHGHSKRVHSGDSDDGCNDKCLATFESRCASSNSRIDGTVRGGVNAGCARIWARWPEASSTTCRLPS